MITPGNFLAPSIFQTRQSRRAMLAVGVSALMSKWSHAQQVKEFSRRDYVSAGRLPLVATQHLSALGERLTLPGKERLTTVGTLQDSRGTSTLRLTWELPGKFSVIETGGGARRIVHNGQATTSRKGATDKEDLDVLESLIADSQENFLYSLMNGGSCRLLGRGFRVGRPQSAPYSGPYYDIYDIGATAPYGATKTQRIKRFYFDTRTGLLAQVQSPFLSNGVPGKAETIFSDWRVLSDKEQVPGVIERKENGIRVFELRVSGVEIGRGLSDGIFDRP